MSRPSTTPPNPPPRGTPSRAGQPTREINYFLLTTQGRLVAGALVVVVGLAGLLLGKLVGGGKEDGAAADTPPECERRMPSPGARISLGDGALTFQVPPGWEVLSQNKAAVVLGTEEATTGAVVVDRRDSTEDPSSLLAVYFETLQNTPGVTQLQQQPSAAQNNSVYTSSQIEFEYLLGDNQFSEQWSGAAIGAVRQDGLALILAVQATGSRGDVAEGVLGDVQLLTQEVLGSYTCYER